MSISLKINNEPNLTKERFLCDVPLHKKLEQYELTKDFLNKFNTTVLIGGQGSGKTSLLIQMIKKLYKKTFNMIIVVMPSYSRASLSDNIFKKLPENQLYDELTGATMEEIYEKVKQNSAEGLTTLLIMDDIQRALKDKYVLNSLKNMVANQRHLKLVNLIIVQNFFALDLRLRELVNNCIIFKVKKSQLQRIFDEYIDFHKDRFEEIIKFVFDEPHQWLFINIGSQRLFRKFHEIIIKEKGEEEYKENL